MFDWNLFKYPFTYISERVAGCGCFYLGSGKSGAAISQQLSHTIHPLNIVSVLVEVVVINIALYDYGHPEKIPLYQISSFFAFSKTSEYFHKLLMSMLDFQSVSASIDRFHLYVAAQKTDALLLTVGYSAMEMVHVSSFCRGG